MRCLRRPAVQRGLSGIKRRLRTIDPSPPDAAGGATDPPPVPAEGFTLVLDYPPSASGRPRWGHGQPSHAELDRVIGSYEENYRHRLEAILTFRSGLLAIDREASDPSEPSWINEFLPGLDGAALYTFVRTHAPAHYLEVGAGNSTKFAARAKRDASLQTRIVSIDPQPRTEINGLSDEVISEPFENVGVEPFHSLQSGDIVFFDGSHRVFTGSDATVFFVEVLPALPPGTLVGIHDVYLPDDYPPEWSGRYYSEQYLLASYLLAGCSWLTPWLASWWVSTRPHLSGILDGLWEDSRLAGVERHGGAFWLQIGERSR